MFNGIIYNQGIVTKIVKRPNGINIFVKSNLRLNTRDLGLSIACDGVCLTLISYKSNIMEFYLSKETFYYILSYLYHNSQIMVLLSLLSLSNFLL